MSCCVPKPGITPELRRRACCWSVKTRAAWQGPLGWELKLPVGILGILTIGCGPITPSCGFSMQVYIIYFIYQLYYLTENISFNNYLFIQPYDSTNHSITLTLYFCMHLQRYLHRLCINIIYSLWVFFFYVLLFLNMCNTYIKRHTYTAELSLLMSFTKFM